MISIIIPTKNVEKYIAQTILSVQAQTEQDWELLIMDNSDDGTPQIVQGFCNDKRISFVHQSDESPWQATDNGIALSRGEYLVILGGQDGFLEPTWLETAVKELDSGHYYDLVFGATRAMSEDGELQDEMHVAYSHFFQPEGPQFLELIKKIGKVSAWKKLCSPSRRYRLNFLLSRKVDNWFDYWRKTGAVFPDQASVVRKSVYLDCAEKYPVGSKKVNHWTAFNFNFNVRGYKAKLLPILATYGRNHRGSTADRIPQELLDEQEKYYEKISKLKLDWKYPSSPPVWTVDGKEV